MLVELKIPENRYFWCKRWPTWGGGRYGGVLTYCNGIKKYGYEVHKILGNPDNQQWHRLTNIKILVDNSAESLTIRQGNLQIIKEINTARKGSQPKLSVFGVIHDYLLFLLSHTKTQLLKKNIRGKSIYAPGDPIKFTLSIPEKWDEVAKWTIAKALALITAELQFGSTKNLFMISESESAVSVHVRDVKNWVVSGKYLDYP